MHVNFEMGGKQYCRARGRRPARAEGRGGGPRRVDRDEGLRVCQRRGGLHPACEVSGTAR